MIDEAHVNNSIACALKGESGLDPEVLKIGGFSTATIRRMVNNLCNIEGLTYLEVGCFKGGTFIASFNNNPINAIGIDDFSQDFSQGDIATEFFANKSRFTNELGPTKSVKFFQDDCWERANERISDTLIDVYFFDGEHSEQSQAKALPAFFDMLADRFIFIVDDANWDSVAKGTRRGFADLEGRVKIEHEWYLHGPGKSSDHPTWWNGVFIFLCEKIK